MKTSRSAVATAAAGVIAIALVSGPVSGPAQARPSQPTSSALGTMLRDRLDGVAPAAGIVDNGLEAVAEVAPNNVWAVGATSTVKSTRPRIVHWNGTTWSVVAAPSLPTKVGWQLTAISVDTATDIWAVGYGDGTNGTYEGLILHYNGHSWTRVTDPLDHALLWGVSAVTPTLAWITGARPSPNGRAGSPILLHWNGHVWTPTTQSITHGNLIGISAPTPTIGWAVGASGTKIERNLVERWTTKGWIRVPAPSPGKVVNALDSVDVIAPGNVWAAGATAASTDPHEFTPLVEHYVDDHWVVVKLPITEGILISISGDAPNDVWAVGYRGMQSVTAELIHWNGTTWTEYGGVDPSQTYLGGVVTHGTTGTWAIGAHLLAGGDSNDVTEAWDGHTWGARP